MTSCRRWLRTYSTSDRNFFVKLSNPSNAEGKQLHRLDPPKDHIICTQPVSPCDFGGKATGLYYFNLKTRKEAEKAEEEKRADGASV